ALADARLGRLIGRQRAVEGDDALQILARPRQLQHARSAEAVTDRRDIGRIDVLVLAKLFEPELPAASEPTVLLRLARFLARHFGVIGRRAVTIDVRREGDVTELGQLFRPGFDIIVQYP